MYRGSSNEAFRAVRLARIRARCHSCVAFAAVALLAPSLPAASSEPAVLSSPAVGLRWEHPTVEDGGCSRVVVSCTTKVFPSAPIWFDADPTELPNYAGRGGTPPRAEEEGKTWRDDIEVSRGAAPLVSEAPEPRPERAQEPKDPKLIPVTPTAGFLGNGPKLWQGIHQDLLAVAKMNAGPFDLLLIGDSITSGWGGGWGKKPFNQAWVAHFGQYKTVNLGLPGDRTQNVLWRLDNGEIEGLAPEVVILAIGANNVPDLAVPPTAVALGIQKCVERIRVKLPDAKLVVVCVFPIGRNPDEPTRRRAAEITAATQKLRLDADPNVRVLDIGSKFLQTDGALSDELMPDFLHPNDHGYEIYARELQPVVEKLLKE